MKLFKKLLAVLRLPSERVDERLSAKAESRFGRVPAMQEGAAGHSHLLDIFFDLLTDVRPAVFCVIGANQGVAGRRALSASPGVSVFSFEANPEIHKRYQDVNEAAGVHWLNLAVSEENGQVTLNVPQVLDRTFFGGKLFQGKRNRARDTGKSSLLLRDTNAAYDKIDVAATRLDDFLQREAPDGRVVLWIHAEGAAAQVLNGAAETLKRADLLLVEVEGLALWKDQNPIDEVLDLLAWQGFVPVLRDRDYGDARFDVVFVRAFSAVADRLVGRIAIALDKSYLSAAPITSASPAIGPATVPVLIPCFNNPTYVRQMLDQLAGLGFNDISLVDNASDSTEMLALLSGAEKEGIRVERLAQNLGPIKSIFTKERIARLPKYFCVTDPDLFFNPHLPADFLEIMRDTLNWYRVRKVGFALDISQPWRMKTDTFMIGDRHYLINDWEERFWRKRVGFTAGGDAIFRASVDTTFALYARDRIDLNRFQSGLRMAGRFTAEHLPWLDQSTISSIEEDHYRKSQRFSYYLGGAKS